MPSTVSGQQMSLQCVQHQGVGRILGVSGQELDKTQITAYVWLVVFTVMTYVCSEHSNRGRQDAKSKISTEVWSRGQA